VRIFTAGLATETNSFSPFATGQQAFEDYGLIRGDPRGADDIMSRGAALLTTLAGADGHEVVAGLRTFAQPGGLTPRSVYETLRDDVLQDAIARGPFEAVILQLHGAMMAEGYDDCEGDMLSRLRHALGRHVFIGAVLDPHAHLTAEMTASADVLAFMKEYPHTDGAERLETVYRLCIAARAGAVGLATATVDMRMLGIWPTTGGAMRTFVDEILQREGRDGVHLVNVVHGFPWGDCADNGAKVQVVADDERIARRVALETAERFWAIREETRLTTLTIDEGLDRVGRCPGLVVLADAGDNPGGGAASESTFVLRRALERRTRDLGFGYFWDPVSVRLCAEAGTGARIPLRIGGKVGPASGDPVDVEAHVRGVGQIATENFSGSLSQLGQCAWVEVDGIHLILTSLRSQPFGPDGFGALGLDVSSLKGVVVKSTQHFRYGFGAIASEVHILGTPGTISMDLTRIPFRKRGLDYWPRVARSDLHG
jgi:microcystin degradation protein MlrC